MLMAKKGGLFSFIRDYAKGNASRGDIQNYAGKPRERAMSMFQKMGMAPRGMSNGGSVRGDGVSRVKTKGKIC